MTIIESIKIASIVNPNFYFGFFSIIIFLSLGLYSLFIGVKNVSLHIFAFGITLSFFSILGLYNSCYVYGKNVDLEKLSLAYEQGLVKQTELKELMPLIIQNDKRLKNEATEERLEEELRLKSEREEVEKRREEVKKLVEEYY